MRKVMKQRIALLMSLAMVFTSVDSSVLVAASDVQESAVEEYVETQGVAIEEQDTEDLFDESDEDIIISETNDIEEEQIIDDSADDVADDVIETEAAAEISEIGAGEENQVPNETVELTENVKIQIKDGLYYSFTPQETAKYYMQLAGYVNQIFYINDEDEIEYVSTGNQYELTKDTTYYICFRVYDIDGESDCTIKKVQEIESITATLSKTKYLKISDNWQSINGNVKVTYKNGESDEQTVINGFCDSYGNQIDMIIKDSQGTECENVYYINELDLGTYSVAWECGDIESQPCSFTVTNEIDTAGELTENVNIQIKDGLYYSFTPQETAKYYMQLAGYVNQILYINDADEIESVSTGNQYELTEGTTYYICFGGNDTNDESDCTIKRVQEIESITATLSKTKYLKISDNWQGINGNVKVTYKNGESDEQTVINDFYDSYGNWIDIIIKDSQGTECENVYNINKLDLGTYSVAWECGDIESQPCSFTVTNEIDTAGELTENVKIQIKDGLYYSFTPQETAKYYMQLDGYVNQICYINDADEIEYVSTGNQYELTKDTTYYICFRVYDIDGESDCTIKKVQEIESITATLSKTKYLKISDNWQSINGNVKVTYKNGESDEQTVINGFCDSYGNWIDMIIKDSKGTEYENENVYSINVNELDLGTYSVAWKCGDIESQPCSFTVTNEIDTAGELFEGNNTNITLNEEVTYYKFKPANTSRYWMRSENDSCDTSTIYHKNAEGTIERIEHEESFRHYKFTAGETYYIGIYSSGSETEYNYTIKAVPEITEVKLDVSKDTYVILPEANQSLKGTVTVQFDNGTSKTYELNSFNVYSDYGYNYKIYTKDAEGNYEDFNIWNVNENEIGSYNLVVNLEGVESNSCQIQLKDPVSVAKKMQLGENEVVSTSGSEIETYLFLPEKTGEYQFFPYGRMKVFEVNEDNSYGDGKTYYSSEMIFMEAEKRYLIYFEEGTRDEWGDYQSRWQMTISEKQSATGEVQVPTISFEEDFSTMEFVYEMDDMDCILDDYCNAVLVFADETMEDVVIDHNVQLEIRDEQNNRVYTVHKPGRYHAIYTWAKTGQELANIPITIRSPEELCEGIWDISKALTLDNQKETHVYKIAAGSNDRTVDISIDKQVKSMVCSADLQEYQMGYGAAVHENLLKDKEYYLVVRTDKKYSDITVTAEIQPEICSLTMSSAQKKYLGEVEYINEDDFKTVIEFSDGTTKSVYGQSSDICFRVNSGDGENSSFSNYYQPGTYQVIPELCTSTAISADYKVTGVSVNVEAINLDTLPELKEGTPLKGVKLVKFIPQDNQRYRISNDRQSYFGVYRLVNGKFEDYYYYDEEDDDDSVILSGGETYVISAREQTTISAEKYQSGGATDKDGGALQLNVEKEVHIDVSGQNVWLSFTPEESGTYVFTSKANDDTYGYLYLGEEELNEDDDGGIGGNFLILENLEAGKTYKYKVRYYSSSNTGSFPVIVRKPVKVKDLKVSSSEWYFRDGELCGTVEIVLDNGEIITEAFKSLSESGFYYENSIVQTVYQKGSKENEFIVKVRYKNGDEEWTLKTVTVTTLKEEKIVLTDTNSVEVPSYKEHMSGTIRVSKSGMYLMKAGNGMEVDADKLYSNGKKIDGNLFDVGFYLESGKEYKFELEYWLENSQNSQISLVEVKQVKQIKITQLPKSYMDRLEALDVSDLKIQVEFSDGTTQNISWNSDDSPLNDGRYIHVGETDVNDSKKKITVILDGCSATGYVQLADPNQLPKVNFAEGKATISIPETKTKGNCVSAIVPSESGKYMVSWTNDAVSAPAKVYTDIELYDENLLNITQLHESDEIVLEAGKTYYVITLMCACTNDKVDPITNLKINFNLTEHEHNWVVDEKAPTCTEDGYKKTICSICKELQPGNEVQIIPKLGHKEVIDSEVTPTCTKTGLTAGSHCEVCKKTIVAQEIVPAIGHTWSDWVPTKEATCTEKGIESHTCSICGETETRPIDKVPHTYSSEYTIDKQPTCTESGIKSRHCTINGCTEVTDEQELPALGHTWGKWEELKPATCAEEGTETRTCAACGKTETRTIEKTEHEWGDWKVTEAATCEKEGTETRTCAVCGKTETRPIEKAEHEWGDWKVTEAATCEKEGTETRTCAVCGKTETRPIDKVPHTYSSEYTIDKQPTCTESGIKSRHCTTNGCTAVTDEQELPALGHTWGKWEELKPATCAEEGTETRTCAACGKTETRPIGKVPHTYSSEYTIDKQPTCTESGIKSRHCTTNGCTAVTDTQVIPALGHDMGSWTVTSPATVLAEGVETRTCSRGDAQETRAIPKLPAKLSVTANSLPMKTGQSTTLFKVTEMAAGDYLASVVSADTSIVKASNVNPNGTFKLTAQKKTGNTKIKITLGSGTWKEVTISVQKAKVKTSAVVPSVRNVTIKQGQSTSVSAVAMPITTADKIKYSTSNKKVATVSSRGVIKGVKAGTAKITIQAGSKKTTVTVKVEGVKTTNLTGVRESATLKKGKKLTISAKKVPSNSGDTITYASSNKKVAAVDKKGKVTAKGIGTAVITVKAGTVIKKMIINVTK